MPHRTLKEQVGGGSQAHGGAGVSRTRLLHCVHRQGSNDIDGLLVEVGPFEGWHEFGAQVLGLRNLVVIGGAGWHIPPTPDPNRAALAINSLSVVVSVDGASPPLAGPAIPATTVWLFAGSPRHPFTNPL
ncbi:hypothetical protein GCM10012278_42070 [Nonomuraea glycinis]|uniref:Uncharacterized protein n=1 Tax=Nonomuraea glycinis TaxID=2047744 RepID=A0A918A8G4_9ACTN|nr:hypothetical protein GCM10012278_42070 [Nonomuraea glycinis]